MTNELKFSRKEKADEMYKRIDKRAELIIRGKIKSNKFVPHRCMLHILVVNGK